MKVSGGSTNRPSWPMRLRPTYGFVSALLTTALITTEAIAAPSKVYSPNVEAGEVELETRGIADQDRDPTKDGALEMKTGAGYGVTNYWFAEAYALWTQGPGQSLGVSAVELESIFQLTPTGKYWADLGFLAEYAIATKNHEPDEVEFGPLIEKQIGRTVHTANLIISKQIGPHADSFKFEYAWASRWRLRPYFMPGFEAFGEMGEFSNVPALRDQEHKIGPAIVGRIPLGIGPGKLYYEAAYLFGLTNGTPDGAFRWLLEYELRF